jgi:hypothetical protein
MAVMADRARCSECSGEFVLKKDGTPRWHNGDTFVNGWRQTCTGVGKPPALIEKE